MGGDRESSNEKHGSLESSFLKAMQILARLDSGELFATSREFRLLHAQCLELLTECLLKTDQLGLFSPNETLDDVNTKEMKFLNLNFYIAKVIEKTPIDMLNGAVDARLSVAQLAARKYIEFIFILDMYGFEADPDSQLKSLLPNGVRGSFNMAAYSKQNNDRKAKMETQRRITKLMQAYEEAKSNVIRSGVSDEEKVRAAEKAKIDFHIAKSWEALAAIVDELTILSTVASAFSVIPYQEREVPYVPSPYLSAAVLRSGMNLDGPKFDEVRSHWESEQMKNAKGYSTKVENPSHADSSRLTGPSGEVKRPFVITGGNAESRRQDAFNNVFGTGQKLPTISIEELVEKELRNRVNPDAVDLKDMSDDEDDEVAADAAIMHARQWDEFVESHARGAGNTMNLG